MHLSRPFRPHHLLNLIASKARPQAGIKSRRYSLSAAAEDDEDVLDTARFGFYNLVLPEDPHREGVSHITPATVPDSIARPQYALRTGALVTPIEATRRSRCFRRI